MSAIRKAIIPVAGMGTRFLPATKAQPKEMLPVVDKPVIQYIVEEAAAAGIEEIIFVTSLTKRAIEDHFDCNFELEYRLTERNKHWQLSSIASIPHLAKFAFVRQKYPLGNGHALLSALPFIELSQPVAVFFGDDIIVGRVPAISQLIKMYERYKAPVVALERVAKKDVPNYGVIGGRMIKKGLWEIDTLVEKPILEDAPSNLAVVGRYILTADVFAILQKLEPEEGKEVGISDALAEFLKQGSKIYGYEFEGKRYDCGNKLQFVIAQIELGVKHPEIKKELRKYLKKKFS